MDSIFKKTLFILVILLLVVAVVQPALVLAEISCLPEDSECGALPPPPPDIPYTCNTSGNITLKDIILCSIDKIFNPVAVLLVSLAGIIFGYGLLQYVTTSGNQAKRDEAKKYITFGILGLVMMLTFWGFAKIITTSLFGPNASSTTIPYPVKK